MAKRFNLDNMMNTKSLSQKKVSYEIEYVPFDSLTPNENNSYSIDRIKELALAIMSIGLEQCLVVKASQDENNKFIIISGHRRYWAIKYIRENYPESASSFDYIPCRKVSVDSLSDEKIRIIINNSTIRDMSDSDKLNQYLQLTAALTQRLEETGEKPSNWRKFVSQMLHVSETQVHRYKTITENLIPEFKEKIQEGSISIQDASEIASLPENRQQDILSIREYEEANEEEKEEEEQETDREPEPINESSENSGSASNENPMSIPAPVSSPVRADSSKPKASPRTPKASSERNSAAIPEPSPVAATSSDFDHLKETLDSVLSIFEDTPEIALTAKDKEKLIKAAYSAEKSLKSIEKLLEQ